MFKNLFKKTTVRVTMIDAVSNVEIQTIELKPTQLPETFQLSTTMHIRDNEWLVVKAEPIAAIDFLKSRSLTLWLQPVSNISVTDIRYSIPTTSNELPPLSSGAIFNDFTISLHEDDWRQIEFLPHALLPDVQKEMAHVEEIMFPEDDLGFDASNGYNKMYVRSKVGHEQLSISIDDFMVTAGVVQKGSITLTGYQGFIQNGFALRSTSHTFYGIVKEGTIRELSLVHFNSIDNEINFLLRQYNLLLVAWCEGMITSAAEGER